LPERARQAPPADIQRPFAGLDKHRRWNRPIADVLVRDDETRQVGIDIANCSSRIGAVLELRDDAAVIAYLQSAQFCNRRLCPFCEWRRSLAWQARLHRGLERYAADHPTDRALFLTLTVKNCPVAELRQTIRDMHEGWKRMTKLAAFPGDHWLRRTEITVPSPEITVPREIPSLDIDFPAADHGRENNDPTDTPRARLAARMAGPLLVHPHMHVLLMVPASYFGAGYVRQTEWQAMWQMSARLDYPPVVDVRTAYSEEHTSRDRVPLGKVVKEAAKYISKASDVVKLGPYVAELHWQIRGLRLIQSSRAFSSYVKNEEPEKKELLDSLEEASPTSCFQEAFAHWSDAQEAYLLED
jgi:plasmid rolling circle replication initiator protein Rep